MDTNPFPPDDSLNEVAQRLSSWLPAIGNLDTERLLFAAGRASVEARRARYIWPTVSACLALLALFFGVWWSSERTERLELAKKFQDQQPAPSLLPPESYRNEPPTGDSLARDAYLSVRRQLEKDLDNFLASAVSVPAQSQDPLPLNPPVLQVWQLGGLLDP
jgi:hypothetical protein